MTHAENYSDRDIPIISWHLYCTLRSAIPDLVSIVARRVIQKRTTLLAVKYVRTSTLGSEEKRNN